MYPTAFDSLSDQHKPWVLDYISGGKGVILCELIKSHEDLDTIHQVEFFSRTEFYSSHKNELISDKECKNVKKFWQTLRLQKLSNFPGHDHTLRHFREQDQRNDEKIPIYPSKMYLGKHHLSKEIISLLTQAEIVELFE